MTKFSQLIDELADQKNHTLSDVLLKAKVLAYRLKGRKFRQWVDSEIGGYDRSTTPPDYRSDIDEVMVHRVYNGCTVVEGDQMRDVYTAGQAGAMGPNAKAENINFIQVLRDAIGQNSLADLASDLEKLRAAMLTEAKTVEQDEAVPLSLKLRTPRRRATRRVCWATSSRPEVGRWTSPPKSEPPLQRRRSRQRRGCDRVPPASRGSLVKTADYRIDCTLEIAGWRVQGLAHVIEISYSERIQFCNFVMQITTDQLDDAPDAQINSPAGLTLENGKRASVRITHFHIEVGYLEVAGAGNFSG